MTPGIVQRFLSSEARVQCFNIDFFHQLDTGDFKTPLNLVAQRANKGQSVADLTVKRDPEVCSANLKTSFIMH